MPVTKTQFKLKTRKKGRRDREVDSKGGREGGKKIRGTDGKEGKGRYEGGRYKGRKKEKSPEGHSEKGKRCRYLSACG